MTLAEPARDGTPLRRGLMSVAVMTATIMYSLDWTIASVALPHMQGTFSATQDQISWVLTSYIVASAIMIPTAGALSRRFGRKRVFLCAVAGFTLASVLCGLAQNLAAEVIFRIAQGAAGAFLIPISQAAVLDAYPREQHGKAMAFWSMGVMLGPILGPTAGGYLTDLYTWRWIFFINVPVGIVAFLGSLAFLPETPTNRLRHFDWLGFASLALGVGAVQMMLDRGERFDWFESGEIVIEAAIAALALYVFVVHSLTTRDPFLNLRLFRDRNYAVGVLLVFLYGFLTLPPIVLMPPFLQHLLDYPVTTIGLIQTPRGVGLLTAALIAGRLANRMDPRYLVLSGILALFASNWAMSAWSLEVGVWQVVWTGFVQGVGAGLLIVPLGFLSFDTLAPEHRTEGSSVFNLVRSVGSSVGVSIALTLLTHSTGVSRSELVEHITPYREALRYPLVHGGWHLDSLPGLSALNFEITRQAAMIGYANDFYFYALASFVGIPVIFWLRRPRLAT